MSPQPLGTVLPALSEAAVQAPLARMTVRSADPLAADFASQLKTYLRHCLYSPLQGLPDSSIPAPLFLNTLEPGYQHQALALLSLPLELLRQEQDVTELQTLMALWQGQQQAWQISLTLRQLVRASRADIHPGQSVAVSLPGLIASRSQLESGYAACDRLACLLDQLERHGFPDDALKALEAEYIDILIELGHWQEELDPYWLSMR